MDNRIEYCNTDLVISSGDDLSELSAAFMAGGIRTLYLTQDGGTQWYATFETDQDYREPEPSIAAMLAVIESLAEPLRAVWDGCSRREFNVGYDCGIEPWAFNHELSAQLLGRIASAAMSLKITLYPNRDDDVSHIALPNV